MTEFSLKSDIHLRNFFLPKFFLKKFKNIDQKKKKKKLKIIKETTIYIFQDETN